MLAMIGEGKTRGQAAILNTEAAHNQNTAAILVSNTPCSSKYLYYFLQLNYENTRRVGSGNNQKALNKERVRALKFPFTSFEEQYQIVTEIESRLSACDSIEQTVDKALTQAEAMRQSILKKAFEGKL
jgi:type I restriction enzyme S subunit